ncbi:hypothetical protein [Pseudomonas sp. FYR_11]|uniref:hypothetical protein n=1 Tax=Pseudomonas TaxID=286 RepID=UPI00370AC1A6
MPTENRSSNTEMVTTPSTTTEGMIRSINALLALDARGSLTPHGVCGLARDLLIKCAEVLSRPIPQPHPEPIAWMVGTAIWWTKEEAERDAAATGLPIVGLGPMSCAAPAEQHQGEPVAFKCWSCKAEFTLKERADCDGCCWKCGVDIDLDDYVGRLAGEVERLRAEVSNWFERSQDEARMVEALRAQLAEPVATVITADQVLGAYQFATFEPAKHLRGTTNWCAAFAQELNYRIGADTAEVERIAKELRDVREERDILQRSVDEFQSRSHGIKNLSAIEQLNDRLAERDALLRESYAEFLAIKAEIGFRGATIALIGRIDATLSVSADPESKS